MARSFRARQTKENYEFLRASVSTASSMRDSRCRSRASSTATLNASAFPEADPPGPALDASRLLASRICGASPELGASGPASPCGSQDHRTAASRTDRWSRRSDSGGCRGGGRDGSFPLHRGEERNEGATVDERERLARREVPGFGRVPTRRHEDAAPGLLGVDDAQQLARFLDADALRLPVLALHEDLAVAVQDQIDAAVRLAASTRLDGVALSPVCLHDEGLEVLPAQRQDRVNARLTIEKPSRPKSAERDGRRDQQDGEGEEPRQLLEAVYEGARGEGLLRHESREEVSKHDEHDDRERYTRQPGYC